MYNPENGHWYEAVAVPETILWDEARSRAATRRHRGLPGHLAAVTSPGEQRWLVAQFPEAVTGEYFLGGWQPDGNSEPGGGWRWVTGEPWRYTHWAHGEPNNGNEGESRLGFTRHSREGGWNDLPPARFPVPGYVVEYEPVESRPPGTGLRPDLVVSWKDLDQRSTGAGTGLRAVLVGAVTVRNIGSGPAPPSRIRFFEATPGGTNRGELLQEVRVPRVGPGKSATVLLSARLPVGRSAIGKQVTAVVNPTAAFPELRQENNEAARVVP